MTEPETATRRSVRAGAAAAGGPSSRAGRNLPVAIATGVTLGVLAAGTLLVHPAAFLAVICVAMVVAVWEMRQALAEGGMHAPFVPVAVGAVSMMLAAYIRGAEALIFATTLTLVAVLIWRVADGLTGALRDVGAGALILLYPCFLHGRISGLSERGRADVTAGYAEIHRGFIRKRRRRCRSGASLRHGSGICKSYE